MMSRKNLLASVAFGALLLGTSAPAAADQLVRLSLDAPAAPGTAPTYGSINPFYGNINPFYGSINPFYGSINPFYGQINPFWGDINPFWGDINPFYGNIDPFYGSINPFWGDINPFYGNINPFYGTIQPFWHDAGPQWGTINSTWNQLQASNATDYTGLQVQLKSFLGQNESFWAGAVRKYTGKSFADGFASDMLAKYGIDPNNAASLANVDVRTRSAFFLNWYDGLMNFTGVDHVDWWMGAIHWSPSLTQIQGSSHATVGILDSIFYGNATGVDNVHFAGGYSTYVNQHGGAVASLIAAQHDGKGIMGIAPDADIELYNPFDATGTANWTDVAVGIDRLYQKGANVVNASLGVPGWTFSQEWVNILTGPLLSNRKHDLVIVKAAGNEGVTQTANVPWLLGLEAPNNILLVGSVGPTGQISSFSNSPGEACLTVAGLCLEQNKLKYRYLVAPGELILVSDGNGGVTRMSGTSFAAPLVTGTVALLEDRWPWLDSHAEETVQIILRSAKDLGAPGVDPVYGWGMLDAEAAQSPLSFDQLVVYQPFNYNRGKQPATGLFGTGLLSNLNILSNWSPTQFKASVLKPGQLNLWQQQSAYVVAFENIGTTYRDFTIPLSTLLVGKDQKLNGNTNRFQSYLYQRMTDWANGTSLGFNAQEMPLSQGAWNLSMIATESTDDETQAGQGPFHAEFVAANRDAGVSLRFGEGSGAHSLMGASGFAQRSDFDPETGGVNPVLGFASGGAYAQGQFAIASNAHLSFGFTQKSDSHTYIDPTFGPLKALPLDTAKASASVMGLDYTLAKGFTVNASYTSLNEDNGLLGAQGSGLFAIAGAHTDATTIGASMALSNGFMLSGSATAAHTSSAGFDTSALSLSRGGLDSTAFELVAAKTGLFGEFDSLRLSFAQPLHVESGALQYRSLQVVDRNTGAVGEMTQSWSLSGAREYRVEALYQTSVLEGRAQIAGFTMLDLNPPTQASGTVSLTVGAQFKVEL